MIYSSIKEVRSKSIKATGEMIIQKYGKASASFNLLMDLYIKDKLKMNNIMEEAE